MSKHFQIGKNSVMVSDLIEFKVIDRAETNLFRQDKDVRAEAGAWGQFFDTLVSSTAYNHQPQSDFGLTWERGSKLAKYGSAMRFARWIKITRGDDVFLAMLTPYEYIDADKQKPYMDYRFVISANNEDLLTTVLLYQDQIMAPVPYEDAPWIIPAT